MYRKGKSHEINDIIDSADATADYSHTNKYYDEVYDNKNICKSDHNTNINTFTSTNIFTNNRFRQNNDNNTTSTSNIFLKASSQSNLFSNNNNSIKNEPPFSLDNENFPSLGSNTKNKNNNISNATKTLDFKKVVQNKTTVLQTVATSSSVHKPLHSSNKLAMYQEIKDKSEKYAKVKMYNECSSDDDTY